MRCRHVIMGDSQIRADAKFDPDSFQPQEKVNILQVGKKRIIKPVCIVKKLGIYEKASGCQAIYRWLVS